MTPKKNDDWDRSSLGVADYSAGSNPAPPNFTARCSNRPEPDPRQTMIDAWETLIEVQDQLKPTGTLADQIQQDVEALKEAIREL